MESAGWSLICAVGWNRWARRSLPILGSRDSPAHGLVWISSVLWFLRNIRAFGNIPLSGRLPWTIPITCLEKRALSLLRLQWHELVFWETNVIMPHILSPFPPGGTWPWRRGPNSGPYPLLTPCWASTPSARNLTRCQNSALGALMSCDDCSLNLCGGEMEVSAVSSRQGRRAIGRAADPEGSCCHSNT